ncbi:MAG: Re/Si-specific NAD(P)(+) transhydrogenase subunit alpha [Hyphomicrobiales bacterium]
MKVAIPKETGQGERRVAVIPDSVKQLKAAGLDVIVEAGAGANAYHPDAAYEAAGAAIVSDAASLYKDADVVLKLMPPQANGPGGRHEAELPREGAVYISFLKPNAELDVVKTFAARKVSAFSMDLVPRSTRAQRMDALSSMATADGYKATLMAALTSPRFFPMFVTAAGTIAPARVLVIGAGVAGLQAIASARRLGAVVEGYDIRPAVKEEVESLGAKFVGPTLSKEETQDEQGYAKALSEEARAKAQELLRARIPHADVIITTARVPGLKAPMLIAEDDVKKMKPGSVIVDLAADQGGNCALTEAGKDVVKHGVTIHGPVQLAATVPVHASQMYSRNIVALFLLMVKDKALNLDFNDDIIRDTCVTHDGKVMHGPTRERLEGGSTAPAGAAGSPK